MKDFPDLMTLKQASDYAQVSRWTLQKWERLGLRVSRVDGTVRIFRSDLEAFLRDYKGPEAAVVSSHYAARTTPERSR